MKGLLKVVRFGCLAFLILASAFMYWMSQVFSPAKTTSEQVVIEVPPGATGGEVAELLEKRGVIRSAFALRLLMRVTTDMQVQAGHYEVDPSKSPLLILKDLSHAQPLSRKATLPEGLTLPEVCDVLGKEKVVSDPKRLLAFVREKGQTIDKSLPANLEGYLFPDTYEFGWDATEEEVVRQMTGRFREVVDPMWAKHKKKAPLSLRETVILASLVEREAQVSSERPLIAGVYINRLKKGMLLQCDATVQFALGAPKKVLTYDDLKLESPYNTYLHAGLPPGPIANPGKASLEAAMSPERSPYLFYVRNDVKGDGSHVFSRTYEEHNDAIRKYQR
ncbi:MAG: hypothetical protein AMXMBFR33_72130 [Candidatus Xenobia bacterium]